MATSLKSGVSETCSSEAVVEAKPASFGTASEIMVSSSVADQGGGDASVRAYVETAYSSSVERKGKPPPLDIMAAQDLQQQQAQLGMTGPKTSASAPLATPGQVLDRRKLKEHKIGHRRVDEEGQITFKKIQTSQIMGSIQLGISHAVGSLASKPEHDLLMQDFTIVETTYFPHDGSNITPAHHYSDFRFKSYAPVAFRYFRDLFGIQPDEYLLSLCNNPMRELTNPGASGSIFYLTDDDEFIIKTIQHKEAEFLQKLLPGYYMNLNQNTRTLLPKFFGLYCYQCGGKNKNVRLVVMNNLLPSSIKMHEKYDLKGSTYKRKASKQERKKSSPIYKDLDFLDRHPNLILLEPETYNALTKTIQRDCRVLESFKIMDYSLLLGIHNVDLAKREKMERRLKHEEMEDNDRLSDDSESTSPVQVSNANVEVDTSLVRSKSINRQRLAAFSSAMESIQAEVEAAEQDEDVPPGGIPAKNAKGEQLLLFLGIIDILQSFQLKKKLEHAWKSVFHDGDTVSVHRPSFYARRFQEFMGKKVFRKIPSSLKRSPSRRKGTVGKQKSISTETDTMHLFPKISSEEPTPLDGGAGDTAVSIPASFSESAHACSKERHTVSCFTVGDGKEKSCANTDPVSQRSLESRSAAAAVSKTASVTWDETEVVSLSQVTIQTESLGSGMSETSSSGTSGLGSTLHTVTWTPPHSVEGSTPTHTEGTPSFTESSSSGDAAFPTTPVKCMNKSLDSLPPLDETQILQDTEMK